MTNDRRSILKEYIQRLVRDRIIAISDPPSEILRKLGAALSEDARWALSDIGLEAASRGAHILGGMVAGYAGMAASFVDGLRQKMSK